MFNKFLIFVVPLFILLVSYTIYQYKDIYLTQKKYKTDYDIIIVGSGLAGLTAAYESNRISLGKAKILLIEKEERLGGNSKKASSGINIVNSPIQHKNNIKDSKSLFYDDTIKSGKNKSDPNLVYRLTSDSEDVYNYFEKLNIFLTKVGILGGHSAPRTHRPEKGTAGYIITSGVENAVLSKQNITIQTGMTAIDLIYENNSISEKTTVLGVIIKNNKNGKINKITSKAVILASGGFAHDFESNEKNSYSLLKEFAPNLMKYPTTNGKQAMGLGLKMARKIGAKIIDMKEIQVHPTGFVDLKDRYSKTKILAAELIRGMGAILINQKGLRYCNELGTRDYVTEKIKQNCLKAPTEEIEQYESFMLINQKGVDNYGDNMKFYIMKGLFKKYNNFDEFIKINNINKNTMKDTIEKYNKNVNGIKDEFGKTNFALKYIWNEPIYVSIITPSLHYTMGGLKITENGEIINNKDKIINGLYGAGEVTGGVHGGNRLGGNSLLECVVFGKRAGNSAINYISKI